MEQSITKARLRTMLGKYRYAVLVILIGTALMWLPQSDPEPVIEEPTVPAESLETMLEEILAQIDGAGQVKVLLTRQDHGQIVYQTDEQSESDGEQHSRSGTTIIVESDDREQGLVRQELEPEYRGAIVVCQGADRAQVRLAIVEAVACVTGLGADQISVLKMK